MYLFRLISASLKALAIDRSAGIAPIFALLLLPMLGIMGFAVDVSTMLAERTRAQNMADAGALDAVRVVQDYMTTNGSSVAVFNQIQTTAQTNGQMFMSGLAAADKEMSSPSPIITVSYSSSTNIVTAKATLNFNFNPAFMGIFGSGFSTVPVSVQSSTSSTLAQYTQVIFLVDVSGSMGVAATASDMTKLVSLTNQLSGGAYPCAFACHQSPSGYWVMAQADYRTIAKNLNINSKIDYAVTAVKDFTTKLASASTILPGHYSTSIYTFGSALNTIQAPTTTGFDAVNTAAGNIDLEYAGDCPGTCGGWTFTTNALKNLKSKITNVGNGSSPTSMLTYLILVTDGVEDVDTGQSGYISYGGYNTGTGWSSQCAAIQSMGVTIATVQAQYPPINQGTATWYYDTLISPLTNNIVTAMQKCASSSDLALSASDGPAIASAVDSLFGKFVPTARLTQ